MASKESDLRSTGCTVVQAYLINRQPDLRIFHYNDVYHVEEGSSGGGVPRFQYMHNFFANDSRFSDMPSLLTFFSGDSLNPSLESTITRGQHMIPVLNGLQTNAACLGNHDLDFGVARFRALAEQCHFPWLCSNVIDPALGSEVGLGNCQRTAMCITDRGLKVGLLGLVEQEWLETINYLPPNLEYLLPATVTVDLAPKLREQGADIIVVLAHQRMINDRRLAEMVPSGCIDIILGGHDHTYEYAMVNGIPVLRSGSDFKQFSYLEAFRDGKDWKFSIARYDVLKSIPEDPATRILIDHITEKQTSQLQKIVGYTYISLDTRTAVVRKAESNFGDMICDIMRLKYNTDCSMICGGTIRSDEVYSPGPLRVRDIINCLPFEDTCVVLKLAGSAICEALENGVSRYPAEDGRFPQISGLSFEFYPALPPYRRCLNVRVSGQEIEQNKFYTLVTRDYMAAGLDGYHMLQPVADGGKAIVLQAGEHGVMLSTILRNFLVKAKSVESWWRWQGYLRSEGFKSNQVMAAVDGPSSRKGRSKRASIQADPSKQAHTQCALTQDRGPQGDGGEGLDVADSGDEPSAKVQQSVEEAQHKRRLTRKYWRRWTLECGLQPSAMLRLADHGSFSKEWSGLCLAPVCDGRIRVIAYK